MNDEFDGYSSDFLEARRGQLLDLRAEITGRSRETLQQIMDQEREVGDSVDTSNEEQDTSTMLRLQCRALRGIDRVTFVPARATRRTP